MSGSTTVLVLAKAPVPGRVKTRLTPPFTPVEAARLAAAALRDTLDAVLAAPARRRVLVLE
ncbi:glycosyltransferase, partial [Streptomyces sp. SID14478]|nr:glycosyltransferase [Streptomyces sp. SID14478]